jgi:tRNA(fMet)-specific endonuclease VapC
MAVFDTTFLIDWSGRESALRTRAESVLLANVRAAEPLYTTRLNVAEMWIGVHRSVQRDRELERVQKILRGFRVLEFDASAAEVFGEQSAHLITRGRPIGDMDILIAAIAITNRQRLVTRNVDHFREIRGLVVESY